MHERTRKRICRNAFFALCLIPTALTGGWAAYQNRPAASDAASERLARAVGCDARVRAFSLPQPGVYEASQLAFYPLDSEWPAVNASNIRWQKSAEQLAARMERIEIDSNQLESLLGIAQRWLRNPDASEFRAQSLTIEGLGIDGQNAYQLRDPRIRCLTPESGEVQVQLVGVDSVEANRLKVQVRRTPAGALTIEIDASETSMPLALAGLGTPLAQLAPEASYQGVVRWEHRDAQWRVNFNGLVKQLKLDQLLPTGGVHRAAGDGRLTIEALEFVDGRIVRLAARLESSDAVLSRSLLVAATRCLYCRVPGELDAADPLPACQLAVGIQIDEQGMTLRGLLPKPDVDSGVVLRRDAHDVLLAPPAGYERLPPVFLAQFVAGVDERWQWHWLPASQPSARLFTLLPRQQMPSAAHAEK